MTTHARIIPTFPLGVLAEFEPFFEVLRKDAMLRRVTQRIPYAASITPDTDEGEIVVVDTLTGDLTVNAPINAKDGARLYFQFTQDATGGHTVTFASVFQQSWTTSESVGAISTVNFRYNEDTEKWVQGSMSLLAIADSAQTVVTGLTIFDRDPLPPFVVTAGSAVVSELDADKLDGQHGVFYRDASNLNAGTLLDARVGQSNVTQHEGALTILESQITDGSILARIAAAETISGLWAFSNAGGIKTDVIDERTAAAGVTVDGLLIKDSGIPQAAVTAHEAALTILESQITDGAILARVAGAEIITGLYTFKQDTAVLTDPTVVLQNLDATAAVLHTIIQRYQFSTTAPATVTAAEWIYSKEQEWTSTASTQDAKAGLWLAQNGSLVNVLEILSGGQINMRATAGGDEIILFPTSLGALLIVGSSGTGEAVLSLSDGINATFRFSFQSVGQAIMSVNVGHHMVFATRDSDVGVVTVLGKVVGTTGYWGFGDFGGGAAPDQFAHFKQVEIITGAVTDGFAAALRLDPGYSAASALTVTRHNYIDVQDVSLAGAGPAALTDACLLRFDAALGTHKATTNSDKTGNAKSGTIIVNVNGTLFDIQLYAH